MNVMTVTYGIALVLGSAAFQLPPAAEGSLRLSLDITQIVMLGGLIWGLAKMSGSIDRLREVTGQLTDASKSFAAGLMDVTMRVAVLEALGGKKQG